MTTKYSILMLLVGIIIVQAEYKCNTTEECTYCYPTFAAYDYECTIENYVVKVIHDEKVKVDWIDTDYSLESNSTDLFSLNIGKIKNLHLRQCPLPDNFVEFMKKLGIESIKELQYDYSYELENIKLTSDYFKGLNNLEELSLAHDKITSIDENIFQDLKNLKSVTLESNKLQEIPNIFKFTEKLKTLDLSDNKLESFPPNFFYNLTKVKTFYLQKNNLRNIGNGIFKGLKSLEMLELSYNKISFISENDLEDLPNLKRISVAKNNLTNFHNNIFNKNIHLEYVNINRNALTALPNRFFANLTKLTEVRMQECNLLTIPENLFENSHGLQKILLPNNKIEVLPKNVFYHLKDLQLLDMSFNKLNELPFGIFQSQTKMKNLNLANNDLVVLNKDLLYQMTSLEVINFQNNRIKFIPNELFQNSIALKTIIFSNNFLKFPENSFEFRNYGCFNYNFQLENLDLSNNNLTFVEFDWILNKTHLKELDLRHNSITFVSFNDFDAVLKEAKINLKYNNISRINSKNQKVVVNMRRENMRIYLESNPINCNCHLYDFFKYYTERINSTVPEIIQMDVEDWKCASPKNLADLPVTELTPHMLECSFDQLKLAKCAEECDCNYRPSDKTVLINCTNRRLTEVPELILPNEELYSHVEVDLSNNLLRFGPTKNMGYENVTRLILSSNHINGLTWMPPKLKVLGLDGNNVSYLNSDMVTILNSSKLANITLGNNPWNCDCLAVDLFNYLVSHMEITEIDLNNITCRNGGKALMMRTPHQLCPISRSEIYIICAISILLLLICITVIIVYNHNKQEIKVWLFAHNLCLRWLSEEELDEDKIYDVFMSYSHKDEYFVLKELQTVLESGPNPYKVCLHIRDWIPGESIAQQIVTSVKQSRRTLIVLSPNFLDSVWGNMEFQIAHNQAMGEGRARVIIVLYGDINVNTDLNEELQAYIKSNTYVKWGDPWFWDKLRYSLPHSKLSKPKSYKNNNILLSINDKSGLINDSPTTPNACSTPPVLTLDPELLKNNPLMFHSSSKC